MLKPGQVSIRPATAAYASRGYRFEASFRSEGKRQRKFFRTKRAAEEWAADWQEEVESGGIRVTLSPEERASVVAVRERIGELGVGLREVLDAGIEALAKRRRSGTIRELVDRRLEQMRREGVSANHFSGSKSRLAAFAGLFGGRKAAEVAREEINDWLAGLGLAADTVRNYRATLHALFEEGRKARWCEVNPVAAAIRPKVVDREIGIFTPAQVAELLARASDLMLAPLAIGLFAGLRAAEIQRLTWDDVDTVRLFIRVGKSKTLKSRRLVEMAPNLCAWLESAPRVDPGRPVVRQAQGEGWRIDFWEAGRRRQRTFPSRAEAEREAGRIATGVSSGYANRLVRNAVHYEELRSGLAASVDFPWPKNGLRHSFASYHLAEHQNAALLAERLGNSVEVVRRHYAEIVHPEEARAFWRISPPDGNGGPGAPRAFDAESLA